MSSGTKAKKRVRVLKDEVAGDGSRRDLRSKSLDEIVHIKSAEAPKPGKSLLRTSAAREANSDDDFQEALTMEAMEEDAANSSDEESALDLSLLPPVKNKKRKSADRPEQSSSETSVVYLGRIPHGFYEDEMREYFSQFGEVKRLRLSRNKKTGASKHYAFIEFSYPSVARIVQETMDNYLLAGHILVCKVLTPEQIHPRLWVGANRKFRPVPRARLDSSRREKTRDVAQQGKVVKRAKGRSARKSAELAELGIEY